jgi:hypothetical protein
VQKTFLRGKKIYDGDCVKEPLGQMLLRKQYGALSQK